jgi:hypothetical protein
VKEYDYELLEDISEREVRECFKKMEGGSKPGIAGIPTEVYKRFILWILPVLLVLFSRILSLHRWPSVWKKYLIVPLLKKRGLWEP